MNEKLNFLKKYVPAGEMVEILSNFENLSNHTIPQYWRDAFQTSDFSKRKQIIFEEWKKYLGVELSNTISYLEEFSEDIDLIKIGSNYSLLYSIRTYQSNSLVFYEGKMPILEQHFIDHFKQSDIELDESIIQFYTKIHAGFNDYTSKSMGLDDLDMIEPIADYDWEFEDQLTDDISCYYNFFSNGMGKYLVLDLSKPIDEGGIFWSEDELPEYPIPFWDYVDEWIIIGLDF